MAKAIGLNSLKFMYNMERFATEIYQTQRRAFAKTEIADKLRAATENEQQHANNLQGRILELNGNPSRLGFLLQIAGSILGLVTRSLGRLFMLKTDIWIEKRAIKDYRSFLKSVGFDEKSVGLIERIIIDEERHVDTWENSIKILKTKH
jgi:bacterioferritin